MPNLALRRRDGSHQCFRGKNFSMLLFMLLGNVGGFDRMSYGI